jgi:hypothetical protein
MALPIDPYRGHEALAVVERMPGPRLVVHHHLWPNAKSCVGKPGLSLVVHHLLRTNAVSGLTIAVLAWLR